ncbi:hypothetical protein ACU635_36675 [[Actinomadura] parvosata]|uniref:hypothetical protein n=1 Tax=[Actinomadura] parvosata TaxID=1955412 RepID=UPI00406D2E12
MLLDKVPLSKTWNEDSGTARVSVEPRWASKSSAEIFGRFDLDIGPVAGGEVPTPLLRDWQLTEAIWALDGETDHGRLTTETVDRLKEIAHIEDSRVELVVGFKKPLREDEVKRIWQPIPDVAFFSPPRDGHLPISWDYSGYCDARGFDDCNPDIRSSLMSGFRRWVGLLKPDDDEALDSFGIELSELKRRAADGLWYGMVLNAWVSRVEAIAKDSRVGVVLIGQAALGHHH